jgi:hypothetical protein
VIPPQYLIVTPEPDAVIADYWEQMSQAAPFLFNVWFAMVPACGTDD